MAARFIIYHTHLPLMRTAKNDFKQERIPFIEMDVTRDSYGLKEMIWVSGQ